MTDEYLSMKDVVLATAEQRELLRGLPASLPGVRPVWLPYYGKLLANRLVGRLSACRFAAICLGVAEEIEECTERFGETFDPFGREACPDYMWKPGFAFCEAWFSIPDLADWLFGRRFASDVKLFLNVTKYLEAQYQRSEQELASSGEEESKPAPRSSLPARIVARLSGALRRPSGPPAPDRFSRPEVVHPVRSLPTRESVMSTPRKYPELERACDRLWRLDELQPDETPLMHHFARLLADELTGATPLSFILAAEILLHDVRVGYDGRYRTFPDFLTGYEPRVYVALGAGIPMLAEVAFEGEGKWLDDILKEWDKLRRLDYEEEFKEFMEDGLGLGVA